MSRVSRVTCLLFGALVNLPAAKVAAYCRTRACDPSVSQCPRDDHGCVTVDSPLYWPDGKTSISLDPRGSTLRNLDAGAVSAVLMRVIEHWTTVRCPDGSPLELEVTVEGMAARSPEKNVLAFIDQAWPYADDEAGRTLVDFELDTGAITHADILLDSAQHPLAIDADASAVDLESVLTHEMGHFLGLDHSDVPGATMQATSHGFGDLSLRSLEADDIAGICSIYGAGRLPTRDESPAQPAANGACSVRPGSHAPAGVLVLCMVMAAALQRRLRRALKASLPKAIPPSSGSKPWKIRFRLGARASSWGPRDHLDGHERALVLGGSLVRDFQEHVSDGEALIFRRVAGGVGRVHLIEPIDTGDLGALQEDQGFSLPPGPDG